MSANDWEVVATTVLAFVCGALGFVSGYYRGRDGAES